MALSSTKLLSDETNDGSLRTKTRLQFWIRPDLFSDTPELVRQVLSYTSTHFSRSWGRDILQRCSSALKSLLASGLPQRSSPNSLVLRIGPRQKVYNRK